ncbi:hypothetical protein YC2023_026109 [Brassica napus]
MNKELSCDALKGDSERRTGEAGMTKSCKKVYLRRDKKTVLKIGFYREASVAVLGCYLPRSVPFNQEGELRNLILQTGINSIRSQPNMRYTETSGRVLRETRVVEDEMFGIENLCWISSRESHILSRKRRFCNIWCSSAHGDHGIINKSPDISSRVVLFYADTIISVTHGN